MADGKVTIDTTLDPSGAEKGMSKLSGAIKNGLAALAAAGAAAGAAIVKTGISYNANMEMYQASMESLLGSSQKAKSMLKDLSDFAASTPFEMESLADATTMMLGFGLSSEKTMGYLSMLGDVSMGNQEKFKSLTLAFSQMGAAGKSTMEDINQMIDAGFNPLTIIAEKTGESMADLRDRVSDGKVSFEEICEAMESATSEGGRFYQAMEKQSQTMKGQWSTVVDNFKTKCGELTKPLSDSITKEALPALNKFIEKIDAQDVLDGLSKAAELSASAIKAIGVAAVTAAGAKGIGNLVSVTQSASGKLSRAWTTAATDIGRYNTMLGYAKKNNLDMASATESYAAAYGVLDSNLGKAEKGAGKLATAQSVLSTGMTKLGGIIAANPIGALVVAVTAATAAYELFDNTVKALTENTQTLVNESQALVDVVDAEVAAVQARQDAYKEATTQGEEEIAYVQQLKGELNQLVDSNGKVKEGYESRAEVIAGLLSEATGIEISLVDGVIDSYDSLNESIDQYIQKAQETAYVEAAKAAYQEIAASNFSLRQSYLDLVQEKAAVDAEMALLDAQYLEAQQANDFWRMQSIDSQKSALVTANGEITQSLDDVIANMANNTASAEYYEGLMAAAKEGTLESWLQANSGIITSEQDTADAATECVQNAVETIKSNMQTIVSTYMQTGDATLLDQLDTNIAMLAACEDQMAGLQGKTQTGGNVLTKKWKQIAAECHAAADSKDFSEVGKHMAEGMKTGINGNKSKPTKAAETMAADTKKAAENELDCHSPSGKFRTIGENIDAGLANGISGNSWSVFSAMGGVVSDVLAWAKAKLGINSPSKVFADVIGSAIPEGIAVGIKGNFDEVQGELSKGLSAAVSYAGKFDFTGADRAQETLQSIQVHFAEPELRDNRTIVLKVGETTLAAVVDRGNRKLRMITGKGG